MALIVRLPSGDTLRFTGDFHVGREPGCDVELSDPLVSRRHAEVSCASGQWIIRDLQSANGLFVNGRRIDAAPIGDGITVVFGTDGPSSRAGARARGGSTAASASDDAAAQDSVEDYAQRYFNSGDDESAGSRTVMIRKAYQKVQQQQKRTHRLTIARSGAAGARLLAATRSTRTA